MPDNLNRSLSGIVDDLWGAAVPHPAARDAAAPAAPKASAPSFPPFEQLWKAVDETVDWTGVLAHDTPNDGLTSPESWALYRRYAARVLAGEPEAYLAVLKAADPLRDLTPWAEKLDVVCRNADSLRVTVTLLPALLQKEGRRYAAGMCLRAARDLFALLPVVRVEAEAVCDGKPLMQVPFERSELQKVRFAFVDPVAFVTRCGGTFADGGEPA
ncbi:MAG: hypothetical protein ACI4O7_12400 [Aristaeellaceae bacterium]